MSNQHLELNRARLAGRLLAKAVQPKLTPAQDVAYAELLHTYRTDVEFREVAAAVAEGLGLRIAYDSEVHGIILVAAEDGPFLSKMRDFQDSMAQRERITYGLLCAMLAAYVFPSVDALDSALEEAAPRVELPAAVAAIRAMCEKVVQGAQADVDGARPPIGAEHLLALREVSRTGDRSTLTSMLRKVCEHHVASGLFQEEASRPTLAKNPDPADKTYRPRPHYRIHVQHVARSGHRALLGYFQQLRSTR